MLFDNYYSDEENKCTMHIIKYHNREYIDFIITNYPFYFSLTLHPGVSIMGSCASKEAEYQPNPLDVAKMVDASEYEKGGIIDTIHLSELPEDHMKPFIHEPEVHQNIQTVMVLYNPFSGKGAAKRLVQKSIVPGLAACINVITHVVESQGPKFFTKYLIDKKQQILDMNVDVFVVVGGDGTYNEFVNGYLRANWKQQDIPVMFFSGGTGNGLCFHMGQSDKKKIRDAVDEFCQRISMNENITTQWLDCIELTTAKREDAARSPSEVELHENVHEDMFSEQQHEEKGNEPVNGHSDSEHLTYAHSQTYWGIPEAASVTAESMRMIGAIRYDLAALYHIMKANARDVKLTMYFDETEHNKHELEIDVSVLTVMKNKYLGQNLMISPLAKLDSGMMDVSVLPNAGRKHTLDLFNVVPKGKHILNADPQKGPFYFRCRKITLEPLNECHDRIGVDGEEGPHTPVTLEVLPKAIKIVYFS